MRLTATERLFHASRTRTFATATSLATIAATMALTFALDWMTGIPHVQHLYYFPIVLAGIRFGMRSGITAAGIAIVLYHVANPQVVAWRYEEFDVLQMCVFVAIAVVAAKSAADARHLHALAMTDDLTGLHSLRSFERELCGIVHAARRERFPVAVLVLDVDRLKRINDEYGHLAGAEAVRHVGHLIAARSPRPAVACRYGGDEFVIALPRAPLERALRLADDLRDAVEGSAPMLANVQFSPGVLSISVGVACRAFDEPIVATIADDVVSEELFRSADAALYAAKNGGRNRVAVAGANA